MAVQLFTVHDVRDDRFRRIHLLDRSGHLYLSELGPVDHIEKHGHIRGHVENKVFAHLITNAHMR